MTHLLIQIFNSPGNAHLLFNSSRIGRFYVGFIHVFNFIVRKTENAYVRNARSEFTASRYHCILHRNANVLSHCMVLHIFVSAQYHIFVISKKHQEFTSDSIACACPWQRSCTDAPGRGARCCILFLLNEKTISFLRPDTIIGFNFESSIHLALGWKRFMTCVV